MSQPDNAAGTTTGKAGTEAMRAAVWNGPGEINVIDYRRPDREAGDALVRVVLAGLCGSDAEEYARGPIVAKPGTILGHEVVGTVEEAAADGSGPPVGTRVVVDVVTGCGACHFCRLGNEGLCRQLVVHGQHRHGGLAELVSARASRLLTIPDHVRWEEAVLAEPLAVAYRALGKAKSVQDGDVVVVGGGTVGLLCCIAARGEGARSVTLLEPSASRRGIAERRGIHTLWLDDFEDRQRAIARLVEEGSPPLVIEAAGRPAALREALALCAPGGTVVTLGLFRDPVPIDALDLMLKEKSLVGSAAHMWDTDVARAVEALGSGLISVEGLVSALIPLDKAADAFRRLAEYRETDIKIAVDCRTPSVT